MLRLIGHEDAFIGVVRQFNREFALYDYEKVIANLMHDMSREDSEEYFMFNILGSWVGEETPGFLYKDVTDVPSP